MDINIYIHTYISFNVRGYTYVDMTSSLARDIYTSIYPGLPHHPQRTGIGERASVQFPWAGGRCSEQLCYKPSNNRRGPNNRSWQRLSRHRPRPPRVRPRSAAPTHSQGPGALPPAQSQHGASPVAVVRLVSLAPRPTACRSTPGTRG